MEKLEEEAKPASPVGVARPWSEPGIYLGTSSFTASGWGGRRPVMLTDSRILSLLTNEICNCTVQKDELESSCQHQELLQGTAL